MMDVTPLACCRSERVDCEEQVVFAEGDGMGEERRHEHLSLCYVLHTFRVCIFFFYTLKEDLLVFAQTKKNKDTSSLDMTLKWRILPINVVDASYNGIGIMTKYQNQVGCACLCHVSFESMKKCCYGKGLRINYASSSTCGCTERLQTMK